MAIEYNHRHDPHVIPVTLSGNASSLLFRFAE